MAFTISAMAKSQPPTWQLELGRQIKEKREGLRYPQKDLARDLNVNRETIRSYEAGDRPPPLSKLRIIVEKLNATFSVEGITISFSTLPALGPAPVAQQTPFDFQCAYTGIEVRVAASTGGFEVKGYAPAKVTKESNSSPKSSTG